MCSMSHNNLIYKVVFSSAHTEVTAHTEVNSLEI